jgi:hypothetical protein
MSYSDISDTYAPPPPVPAGVTLTAFWLFKALGVSPAKEAAALMKKFAAAREKRDGVQ